MLIRNKYLRPTLVTMASALALGAMTQPAAAAPAATLINAGGAVVTDSAGKVWSADRGFVGGWDYSSKAAINATSTPALFQSERAGLSAYNLPVAAAGTYRVTLNFAEIYWTAKGKRVFSVTAEGRDFIRDLDIFAVAGKNKAMSRTIEVPVTDGTLNLRFSAKVDEAKVSSLLVSPVTTGVKAPAPAPKPAPAPALKPAPAPAPSTASCTKTMAAGGNVEAFINGLSAGNVGCLPGGTYSGANVQMSKSGASGSPITIQSVPGQTAKLRMQVGIDSSWVVFRGLSFERNEFANSGRTGTSSKDGQCLYADSGTSNIRIVQNTLRDCGSLEHFHHALYLNGTGYTVSNNVVLRAKAFGIQIYPNLANSLISNNSVDGAGRAGVIIAGSSRGNRVVNNLLTNNALGGVDGYDVGGANTVQDNQCFGNGSECIQGGNGFTGSGNVTADPQYLNRGAGDLRVAAGSAAVGSANTSYAAGPDRNGVSRPQGGAPDKGAFER